MTPTKITIFYIIENLTEIFHIVNFIKKYYKYLQNKKSNAVTRRLQSDT